MIMTTTMMITVMIIINNINLWMCLNRLYLFADARVYVLLHDNR